MDAKYYDRDGFVKSHLAAPDAGNDGITLTVVAGLLGAVNPLHMDGVMLTCIDRDGNLLRRPDNSGGHQSHDGWMAIATWLLFRGFTIEARGLLLSAIIRGFYMKHHRFEFEGKTLWQKIEEIMKPWMGRYPRIWTTMFVAAFPCAGARLLGRACLAISSFSKLDLTDASGCQLKWLDQTAATMMGNSSSMASFLKEFRDRGTTFTDVMSKPLPTPKDLPYWDADHTVIASYWNFEKAVEQEAM